MTFKKSVLLSVLTILVSAIPFIGCNSAKLDSFYTEKPINIDGNYADWENIPATYYEDQDVLFAVSNDDDYLYLAFRFRDPKWAMTIRRTGLTIWLDTLGKKKENFGICYTGGPKLKDIGGLMGQNRNMEMKQENFDMRPDKEQREPDTTRQFVVLNSDWWYKEQKITTDGSQGPAVKYGIDKDMYTYEFAIPLTSLQEPRYGIGVDPGDVLSIGLQWGDMGMNLTKKGDRPEGGMGGGPPGGGGGMPGGGMPGGGMGGGPPGGGMGGGPPGGGMRPGGQDDMPEEQKIWIKTKLATAEMPNAESD